MSKFWAAKQAKDTAGLELKYWAGRGLMEVPRLLLAIDGKFPQDGDYQDGRYTTDPVSAGDDRRAFADLKDQMGSNLGRMPIAKDGEKGSIGQSGAINFLVASKTGLMGGSAFEAAAILSVQEHIAEMNKAYVCVPRGCVLCVGNARCAVQCVGSGSNGSGSDSGSKSDSGSGSGIDRDSERVSGSGRDRDSESESGRASPI